MAIFRMLANATDAEAIANVAPMTGADAKQFGFENFGNTCYINAILQALYFCVPFRDLVISTPDSSFQSIRTSETTPSPSTAKSSSPVSPKTPGNTNLTLPASPPTLFSALRSLFIYIARNPNDKGKVSPTAFVQKVKAENEAFRNTNHQDAHEALNFILNKVMEELEAEEKSMPETPSSLRSRKTLIRDLFEGILTSETRCLTCKTVSSRDESFLDLSIDIEPHSSVTACLRQFSASEMLCQKNKFSCDACSGLQEAEKSMKVKKLPNILALHLKRFKYQEDTQKFIKLSYRVAFPLELRLFNTVDNADNADRLYELFAIVVHIGGGPHHGHYTAIIRSQASWFLYDDDNVEPVKESDIPKYFGESSVGAGYVLFYQAINMDYPNASFSHSNEIAVPFDTEALGRMQVTPGRPPTIGVSLNGLNTTNNISVTDLAPQLDPSTSQLIHQGTVQEKNPVRLRHSKSEKNIPIKIDSPSAQSLPPLPILPVRRPKTGDGTALERRKSWFKNRAIQKRSAVDPPSAFIAVSNTEVGYSPKDSTHARVLSTVSDSFPSTGDDHISNAQIENSDEKWPELVMVSPAKATSHNMNSTDPLGSTDSRVAPNQRLDFPSRNDITLPLPSSPLLSNGIFPSSIHATNNFTTPLRKAVRKMSLSNMPMKLGILGKREK